MNADAQFIQQFLRGAGMWHGPVDGNWNDQLAATLATWQHAHGLAATGTYDLATRTTMSTTIAGLAHSPTAGTGVDPKIRDEALKRYGPAFAAYLNHPELGPILIRGAREGRDMAWLQGQLQQTEYWKHTQEATRAWDQMLVSDPGSAQAKLHTAMSHVTDLARSAGVAMSNIDIRQVAVDSLRFAWDDNLLRDVIVNATHFNPKNPEPVGDLGTLAGQLKAAAAEQLVNLNDRSAFGYAQKIARGEANLDAYTTMFRNQAISRHPHLTEQLRAGTTLKEFFDPLRQDIANTLEVAPDSIDFLKGRYAQVVDYADPNNKGAIRSMSRTEAMNLARADPAWQRTRQANERGAQLEQTLLKTFGAIG